MTDTRIELLELEVRELKGLICELEAAIAGIDIGWAGLSPMRGRDYEVKGTSDLPHG